MKLMSLYSAKVILRMACLIFMLGIFEHTYGIYNNSDDFEGYAGRSKKIASPREFVNLTCIQVGMFSSFMSLLGALHIYEKGDYAGVKVCFGADGNFGTYYDPGRGSNWWEYYFKPITVGNDYQTKPLITAQGTEACNYAFNLEFNLSRKAVNEIIKKYIFVRKRLLNVVDNFISSHFKGQVIGVHYRGTDKCGEAPRASYAVMEEHINSAIASFNDNNNVQIFIATDEEDFIDYMKERYPSRVIYFENAIRSRDGNPVHLHSQENYKKGEDALLDCLLLSKCNLLIKTSSNLSLCSTYFNPSIPVRHVTLRHGNMKPPE
jgi:hypothetical protein